MCVFEARLENTIIRVKPDTFANLFDFSPLFYKCMYHTIVFTSVCIKWFRAFFDACGFVLSLGGNNASDICPYTCVEH